MRGHKNNNNHNHNNNNNKKWRIHYVCAVITSAIAVQRIYMSSIAQNVIPIWTTTTTPSPTTAAAVDRHRRQRSSRNNENHHHRLAITMDRLLTNHAARERERLVAGLNVSCESKDCVFNDVQISMPLAAPIIISRDWLRFGDKSVIDPALLFPPSSSSSNGKNNRSDCVVYAMGIAHDSRYERTMANFCEVHAFDCTIELSSASLRHRNFEFHQTCIGSQSRINETWYGEKRQVGSVLEFERLSSVMNRLGHSTIDVLKFDIEGNEWELLESEILLPSSVDGGGGIRPRQLIFELHTQGAHPKCVPPSSVAGRLKPAVNRLFIALHDLGYRVVTKQINGYDRACCDFTMMLLHDDDHDDEDDNPAVVEEEEEEKHEK